MIDPKTSPVLAAFQQLRSGIGSASSTTAETETYKPKGREVFDIVDLSDGTKLVNLERGNGLAAEIRAEQDPSKISDMLNAGAQDISRVGLLFREVMAQLKAIFVR